ncbi:UDP-N-acetylmuramoyl-L-alanyl-D-glutamate synthetase, partial [Lacticaseibacillus paracasei subsp. paracasei Lpp123]
YNDSKATNVEAATVALNAFDQPIVWLAGGLDRGLPMDALTPLVKKHVKSMVVFGQTAPLMAKIAKDAGVPVQTTENVMTAVPLAYEVSRPGDVILLSPAAASWDQYPNFEVRGDDFIKAVNQLKATVESGDK